MKTIPDRKFLIAGLLINLPFMALAFQAFDQQMISLDYYAVSQKLRLLRIVLLAMIVANGLAIPMVFSPIGDGFLHLASEAHKLIARAGLVNLLFAGTLAILFTRLVHNTEYGLYLQPRLVRLWMIWLFSLIGGTLLIGWRRELSWFDASMLFALATAMLHTVVVFSLRITDYPLSLGWSEVSRYYQSSFFFSERLYGLDLPWSVTHHSRYVLQAIPFLFPSLGLVEHRAWEVILWLLLTALAAWVLAGRIKNKDRWLKAFIALWALLFMFQGAVFFHLMLCLIPVWLTFDRERYGWSLLFVILASVWAGISRINWAPMPGLLAAVLMYLEQPVGSRRPVPWRYFWRSFSYFLIGLAVALLSYWAYIQLSGVEAVDQFGSSFTSALLWNRLWPNPSFGIGIIPGISMVALPLLILIVWRSLHAPNEWHPIRLLGITAISVVLFIGGLVVSVKIGGGTNLHNMDAFMVILMVVGLYLGFDRHAKEPDVQARDPWQVPAWLLALIVAVPVGFAVTAGGPMRPLDQARAQQVVDEIDAMIAEQLADGGEVLFLSQRQLLVFDMLQSDPALVPDYEQLFLMEMAISHNRPYLEGFYADIAAGRFELIISDPIAVVYKVEGRDSLAAENNAWVEEVSWPLLCAYEHVRVYRDVGVQILAPRDELQCEVTHAPPADQ